MIASNLEVQMRNHICRLITGAFLSMVNLGVIRHYLEFCSADIWRPVVFFSLLALWVITIGAVLGALIYYDLRYSLRELGSSTSSDNPWGLEGDGNV